MPHSRAPRSCCGAVRQGIGGEESWQIEYVPGRSERVRPVRRDHARARCEPGREGQKIAVVARAESPVERGLAGPGLLACIVTSKFADCLPAYPLEYIFGRQVFEISRATQSVWCGDVAGLVEPLCHRMAERVCSLHVVATDDTVLPTLSAGKAEPARMWVYVGEEDHPCNEFDFTLDRGRDGRKQFLKDYTRVLLADAYGGYSGVVAGNAITRAGCWAHGRRKVVEAEKTAPEIAPEAARLIAALFAIEKRGREPSTEQRLALPQQQSAPRLAELRGRLLAWKEQLLPKHPMAGAVNDTPLPRAWRGSGSLAINPTI